MDTRGYVSKLHELCLLQIVQNFDRLCAAHKIRNSKVPKQHWEFLERRYSEKIFKKLKQERKLKREHLDLLINPHTKKLDIDDSDKSILPDLVERLKERGTNILTFRGLWFRNMDEDICTSLMSALPKVEEIVYSYAECFSAGQKKTFKEKIMRFRKMSASVRFAQIPEICETIGQKCRFLKSLTLTFSHICFNNRNHNNGIAFILKNCSFLETLRYDDVVGALYELHKRDLPLFKNYKKLSPETNVIYLLKNLSSRNRFVDYYPLSDALAICATTCPHVSRLNIQCLRSDKELEMISRFTGLQDVEFEDMDGISSSCLGKFLELRGNKLTSLEIPYKSGLPIERIIESCTKLESLILSWVELPKLKDNSEHSCKASLLELKNVKFLYTNFYKPEADAALKMILSAAKNIENLSLSDSCGLTSKFLRNLDLSRISLLDASSSDVTVDSLTELVLHSSPKTLQIDFCYYLESYDYSNLTLLSHNNNVHIEYDPYSTDGRWKDDICLSSPYAHMLNEGIRYSHSPEIIM